jgi:putative nucleotidyltransferase with HDIG domain
MRKFFIFFRNNKKKIFQAGLFLLTIIIVTSFFPREGKFRYEYQKGKPWMHDDLYADYDFPIYKSESRLNAERDSILGDFNPYFRYDSSVVVSKMNDFLEAFDQKWANFLSEHYNLIERVETDRIYSRRLEETKIRYLSFTSDILEHLYLPGIVEVSDILERVRDEGRIIVILKGNIAEQAEYTDVFTFKRAYEYIVSELNTFKVREENGINPVDIVFLDELNLSNFVRPNLFYDEETSTKVKESLINEISITLGMVQSNQLVISKGEVVSNSKFRILESLRQEHESRLGSASNYYLKLLGSSLLVIVSILMLYLFLLHFRSEILDSNISTSFILLLVVIFIFISSIVNKTGAVSFYFIPFVFVPIIIRTFYDARLALFIHLVIILVVGFFVPNSFEFVFLNVIAGIVAIFSLTNTYRRGQFFLTAILIFLSYGLVYAGIGIIQENNIRNLEWINYAWFAGNSALILLTLPLIYIFEKLFGFLSDATLLELSDTNQPLLRKLGAKAPGTFQHSMQVANLAEEAVRIIGGNALLLRTGALYHDIGKMYRHEYFIENQSDNFNPHERMEFSESAEIIINHVERGVELARKNNLPKQVIDFIRTHHGTTKAQYFYRSYIRKYPHNVTEGEKFTYPGPKPSTKETAILMMADSVEAASRSLKAYNEDNINDLVEDIIRQQIEEEQFTEAPITFNDINLIKETFKKQLINIYHLRIEYPKEESKK